MAKSRKLETLLADLQALRANPTADSSIATLRQIVASKQAIAITHAAKLISDAELRVLMPDLALAFERFMVNPVDTDPNCHAKVGIADALYRLDYGEDELFLRGIRHIQKEPVWGGQVDTAPKLRGICAMGLVRMNYPAVMTELADLLADPEAPARIAAARAIAYSGNDQGIPLLRLRARIGDEPEVISECLTALLQLAPTPSLPFVAQFLQDPNPQIQELSALALGESRQLAAFELLRHWWEQTRPPELRQAGLLAIAMLRQDPALQFLLDLIATGRLTDGLGAIAALKLYRHETLLWQRVQSSAQERGDAALLQATQ